MLRILAVMFAVSLFGSAQSAELTRIKDLGRFEGWRDNALVGYGLVTGLAGTGDSAHNRATQQALSNVMSQFGSSIPPEMVQSRNVAIAMVTASLPPFARSGDKIDVVVTSVGDARSLVGGSLLLTSLKGPDNKIHALAQGALSVGGYKYDLNGNVSQKNHPTVAMISNGANIELAMEEPEMVRSDTLTFVLREPDYTTASRVSAAINELLGANIASARNPGLIEVKLGERRDQQLVTFIASLEGLEVSPDLRARVIINERTGTVVSGGDIKISKVVVTQGGIKLAITTENQVSQPLVIGRSGVNVRTEVVPRTKIDVAEGDAGDTFMSFDSTVSDVVRALTRMKINTRDIISVLQGIKSAGAMNAELIVQ